MVALAAGDVGGWGAMTVKGDVGPTTEPPPLLVVVLILVAVLFLRWPRFLLFGDEEVAAPAVASIISVKDMVGMGTMALSHLIDTSGSSP